MLRRGSWIVLVVMMAGLLAVASYIGWTAGHQAGSPHGHAVGGVLHLGMGFMFMAMVLLFLSVFISKLFFWRRGPGHAYAGRWFTRWEEWHENYHREHDEKGERGGSPEPPNA